MNSKKLSQLLEALPEHILYGDASIEITSISDDSRKAQKGSLFVAIKGKTVDSHQFIPDVIERGTVAVIGEGDPGQWAKGITYVKVPDSRVALSLVASEWFGNPSHKLKMIGVTGTDGKTTTSNIIYSILDRAGIKTGLISTINAQIGDKEYDTGFHVTNPEPLLLHELLAKMLHDGIEYAVLEVTSHGIDQGRIAGIPFKASVITNITHEHIDYHKTFENYRDTKAKLLEGAQAVVLNADDPSFTYLKDICAKGTQMTSYGIRSAADLTASGIKTDDTNMEFDIISGETKHHITTTLLGEYNIYNCLAAVSIARDLNIDWEFIKSALATFKQLTGRLEKIPNDKGLKIYVDFAHTPNALEKVLTLLAQTKTGNLIAVFGCAGERDIEKRKLMPQVAIKLADISIFTAEDPRSEDIEEILTVMAEAAKEAGGIEKQQFFKIAERGQAIYDAINKLAKVGDTVVVCGKGHEKSMAYNRVEYPWSDQEAVRLVLKGKIPKIERK